MNIEIYSYNYTVCIYCIIRSTVYDHTRTVGSTVGLLYSFSIDQPSSLTRRLL